MPAVLAEETLEEGERDLDALCGLYFSNRYYDPATASFLSVDPAVGLTQAPFTYGNDNPVNSRDPIGLDPSSAPYRSYTVDGLSVELNCDPSQASCQSKNAWIFQLASQYRQQECQIQAAKAEREQEARTLKSIEYAQEQIELIAEGKVAAPESGGLSFGSRAWRFAEGLDFALESAGAAGLGTLTISAGVTLAPPSLGGSTLLVVSGVGLYAGAGALGYASYQSFAEALG